MHRIQLGRLRATFELFRPCGPAMIAFAFSRLAENSPKVRSLFPDDTTELHKPVFDTLRQLVRHAHEFQRLEGPLMRLGRDLSEKGGRPHHLSSLRDAVLAAMSELAGDVWTAEVESDWRHLFDAASGAMLRGAVTQTRRAA